MVGSLVSGQALGPRNVELVPQQLQRIRHAFAYAGVPDASVIYAIDCICTRTGNIAPDLACDR